MASVPSVVGGDVDAFCTKCKLMLGHTILAMVGTRIARVRCNTCQGEHTFRAHPPGAKKPARRKEAVTRSGEGRASTQGLDELLEGRDASHPRRYSPGELFSKGEVLDHASFGTGVIVDIRGDRLDAVFRAGLKTLAQKKAHGALAKRHDRAPPGGEALEDIEAEPPADAKM